MKFLQYFGIAIIFLGFLASQVKSLLSTTGYAYEPVSGDEQEGNLSSEIFTAYHECWGMEECGYVAKRKNDGQFVKLKIGATLNNTKYSHIWKKRTEDINECASNPCNKGTCVDQIKRYKCICKPGFNGTHCDNKMHSCADLYKSGTRNNGIYTIFNGKDSFEVYCDFESEANSTWTLVMSYALKNTGAVNGRLYVDNLLYTDDPNWDKYRASKGRMEYIRNNSTLWRATCNFEKLRVDYRDYLRGKNSEFDIISFVGTEVCKKVQYINIRGHTGFNVTVPFWQGSTFPLHTDSAKARCNYDPSPGAVGYEDNFGYYGNTNPAFRCTENENGTTQIWFGDYL